MNIIDLIKYARGSPQAYTNIPSTPKNQEFAKGKSNRSPTEFALGQQRNIPIVGTNPMGTGNNAVTPGLQQLWNKSQGAAMKVMTIDVLQRTGMVPKAKPAMANKNEPLPKDVPSPSHEPAAPMGAQSGTSPAIPGRHQRGQVTSTGAITKTELQKQWVPQNNQNSTNTKPPPPMTTRSTETSGHPTQSTALVRTGLDAEASNPIHDSPKTVTNVQKIRNYLKMHPYGTAGAALAIMAVGTGVLATAKHQTEKQRELEEKKKRR